MKVRIWGSAAALGLAAVLSACGSSGKTYDISPIFPLTPDKCAEYHGEQEGSGVGESCMVSKGECERAVANWREAMQSGGVDETIEFTCE
jgi:hypothetical protein